MRRLLLVGASVLVAVLVAVAIQPVSGLLSASSGAPRQTAPAGDSLVPFPQANCFWGGPFGKEPYINLFYPDAGAYYWASNFRLPAGASIVIKGAFAHARYESFTAYGPNVTAAQAPEIHDDQIQADPGSTNPFVVGALRTALKRSFTLTVLPEAKPSNPAPNTLYVGPTGATPNTFVMRMYVPDQGQDVTGGVGLPGFEVHLADGRVLSGTEACNAINPNATHKILTPTGVTADQWTALRDAAGEPNTWPAVNPPVFRAEYNLADSMCRLFQMGTCDPHPVRSGGIFSNPDADYLGTWVNRGFGPVVVLTGKMPTTAKTYNSSDTRMTAGQLRYWSVCSTESPVTRYTGDCLFDQQIPHRPDGSYTIVLSTPTDRPHNAVKLCGVGFIQLSPRGDGVGALDLSRITVRNMLPAPDFHNAAQDTTTPGDEAAVLGPYLPRAQYMTTQQFQQLGCPAQPPA